MVTGKPHKPSRFTRFVLYPIVGMVFFVILTIVLTLANGYRFTYTGGKVGLIKTGMLIVTTRPFDAAISLNGKPTKYKTGFHLLATKIPSLKPGEYSIQITKKGYRTWNNTLEIKPNMVTWANYVLLFAEKLNITKISTPEGKVISSSENGRHVLFATSSGTFGMKSMDSANQSVRDFWPTVAPTQTWLVNPQIQSADFSPNSEQVLLRITNGEKTEFVVSDTGSGQPKLIHLNTTLGADITKVWWNTTSNGDIFVQSAGGISHLSINATALSEPILKDVVSIKVDESRQLLFVTKNDSGMFSVEKSNLDGGNRATLVSSIAPAKSYKLGYSTSRNIITVLNVDTGELTAHYTGNSSKKTATILSTGVTDYGWLKNGDYLYYFGKDFVKRYDWEKNKETEASLALAPNTLHWYFDESHYLVSTDKGIYVMDYDGSNVVSITDQPSMVTVHDTGNSNVLFTAKNTDGLDNFYKFISEF